MDRLNEKIRSTKADNQFEAQSVGIYAYSPDNDRLKRIEATNDNLLKVSLGETVVQVNDVGGGGGTQYDTGTLLPLDATGTVALVSDNVGNAATLNVTAGGALRVDESGITVGSDDTLTQAQQVLSYARKDASPSGLRALKCADDGTLHNYDTGLNMKITSGSDATLASAQQVLCYGRDALGGVDALKVDNQGHLEVVQDPEQQTNLIFSGSQAIGPAGSFAFTASADKNGAENINIFVSGSSSLTDIEVYTLLSFDDVSYYEPVDSMIGAMIPDADKVVLKVENNPARYVRIRIVNNGVASVTIENITIAFVKGI